MTLWSARLLILNRFFFMAGFKCKKISTKIASSDLSPSAFFISKPGTFAVWWRKSGDSAIHSFTHHLAANHWTDSAVSCQWHQTPTATACQNNNTTERYNVFHVCYTAPTPDFRMFRCDSWIWRNWAAFKSVREAWTFQSFYHPCVERNHCSSDLFLSPTDWGNANWILVKDCQLLDATQPGTFCLTGV